MPRTPHLAEQLIIERIKADVSPGLALWMQSQLNVGFELSRVEKHLRSALAIIEIERSA